MFNIRPYKSSDYEMIKSWWIDHNEPFPPKDCMPEDTTFILEIKDVPSLSICLYLTNCKGVAYLENFISNPNNKSTGISSGVLVEHAISYAKLLGYKRILCLTDKDSLKNRYQKLGMKHSLSNLHSLVREL